MDERLRQLVRRRAKSRCEYCQVRQQQEPLSFHIEHITPRQHGGKDVSNNLALACHHCNLHKGPNLSGLDPRNGKLTRLYHPRLDDWEDHFTTRDGEIAGRTAIGRTTVKLLRMNENGRVQLRESAEA
jgi:5-methylcytosine-specific restriction endonuclease McrA